MALTTQERESFWEHWCSYVHPLQIDPYLQDTKYTTKVRVNTSIAAWVQEGYYGFGCQVSVLIVLTALRAIGHTCALGIGINPLYRHSANQRFVTPIKHLLASYQKEDLISVPEIVVPVRVVNECHKLGNWETAMEKERTQGQIALVAFYYLLRVGEYSNRWRKQACRMQQFCLCDVAFWHGTESVLATHTTPEQMMLATAATLRLSNQKNGI